GAGDHMHFPGLDIAAAGCARGRLQNAADQRLGNRLGQKAAHTLARYDGLFDDMRRVDHAAVSVSGAAASNLGPPYLNDPCAEASTRPSGVHTSARAK